MAASRSASSPPAKAIRWCSCTVPGALLVPAPQRAGRPPPGDPAEHPGAGTSVGLEHVEDLWDLVLYYAERLDTLGLPRATLVGHSFGGMVAAEIAATNPERVDRLVLIAPVGLWLDDHPIPDFSGVPPSGSPKPCSPTRTGPSRRCRRRPTPPTPK